jgi:hypothetical protein
MACRWHVRPSCDGSITTLQNEPSSHRISPCASPRPHRRGPLTQREQERTPLGLKPRRHALGHEPCCPIPPHVVIRAPGQRSLTPAQRWRSSRFTSNGRLRARAWYCGSRGPCTRLLRQGPWLDRRHCGVVRTGTSVPNNTAHRYIKLFRAAQRHDTIEAFADASERRKQGVKAVDDGPPVAEPERHGRTSASINATKSPRDATCIRYSEVAVCAGRWPQLPTP